MRSTARSAPSSARTFLIAAAALSVLLASGLSAPSPARAGNGDCLLAGAGTAESPYLVDDAIDLARIGDGDCGLDAQYRQTANITLTGPFTPIGMTIGSVEEDFGDGPFDLPTYASDPFTGTYDGDGFWIEGLDIDLPTDSSGRVVDVGLFSQLASATVRDLEIRDARVRVTELDGTGRAGRSVGILAGRGQDSGTAGGSGEGVLRIEGVRVSGSASASSEVGGLLGIVWLCSDVVIDDVRLDVIVTSGSKAGGAAGQVRGDVQCGGDGGVTDRTGLDDGDQSISNVRVDGVITATGNAVGGLVGELEGGLVSIERVLVTGRVQGGSATGGLVGLQYAGRIASSAARVEIRATDADRFGGLVGSKTGAAGTIDDAYAITEFSGPAEPGTVLRQLGGLLGSSAFGGMTVGRSLAISTFDASIPLAEGNGLVGGVGEFGSGSPAVVFASPASFYDLTRAAGRVAIGDGQDGPADQQSATARGVSTAGLRTLATFADAGWPIVAGWVDVDVAASASGVTAAAEAPVWGICRRVNDGYPFLLWEYDEDPCVAGSRPGPDRGASPVPTAIPSGRGPAPFGPLGLLLGLAGLGLLGSRSAWRTARRSAV